MKEKDLSSGMIALSCVLWLLFIPLLYSCGGTSKQDYKDPEAVEVKDSDRSIQYYLPMNIQAFVDGKPQTTNDLKPSGRLLLTSGGNIKGCGFASGYKKVYKFRCEAINSQWYKITCWLKGFNGEYTMECYTKEKI